jgi:hypothetical protein
VTAEAAKAILPAGESVSARERERARGDIGYGGGRALPAVVAADLSAVTAEAAEAALPAGESVSVSQRERAREGVG